MKIKEFRLSWLSVLIEFLFQAIEPLIISVKTFATCFILNCGGHLRQFLRQLLLLSDIPISYCDLGFM